METLGGIFVILYGACVVCVVIYILRLLGRFVRAQEKVAAALEIVASKSQAPSK